MNLANFSGTQRSFFFVARERSPQLPVNQNYCENLGAIKLVRLFKKSNLKSPICMFLTKVLISKLHPTSHASRSFIKLFFYQHP